MSASDTLLSNADALMSPAAGASTGQNEAPAWSGDPDSFVKPKVRRGLFHAFATSGELADEKFGYAASLDKKKWIDAYFGDGVELFPDFNRPSLHFRNYDVIQYEDIKKRFPADEDVRVFIKMTREIVVRNFLVLVVVKRLIAILALGAVYLCATTGPQALFDFVQTHLNVADLEMIDAKRAGLYILVGVGTLIFLIFVFSNSLLYSQFIRATQATCSFLTQNIQGKLSKMESAYTTSLKNIRDQYAPVNRDDPWPDRAYWTAILILWYPKRVENIEKAFQIDMWRTRLAFTGVYVLGLFLSFAVFGAAIATLATAVPDGAGLSVALGGYAATIVAASYFFFRPPLRLIRDYVDGRYWTTFESMKMHESVAAIIKADKLQILDELNRQRGGRPNG